MNRKRTAAWVLLALCRSAPPPPGEATTRFVADTRRLPLPPRAPGLCRGGHRGPARHRARGPGLRPRRPRARPALDAGDGVHRGLHHQAVHGGGDPQAGRGGKAPRGGSRSSKYLPGVPADKAGITLHHLLTHTSGIEDDYSYGDFDPVDREKMREVVLEQPLAAPPGSGTPTSNAGYSLLGMIVERVSGQSYETFLGAAPRPRGHDRDRLSGAVGPRRGWPRATGAASGGAPILERPWDTDGPYWTLARQRRHPLHVRRHAAVGEGAPRRSRAHRRVAREALDPVRGRRGRAILLRLRLGGDGRPGRPPDHHPQRRERDLLRRSRHRPRSGARGVPPDQRHRRFSPGQPAPPADRVPVSGRSGRIPGPGRDRGVPGSRWPRAPAPMRLPSGGSVKVEPGTNCLALTPARAPTRGRPLHAGGGGQRLPGPERADRRIVDGPLAAATWDRSTRPTAAGWTRDVLERAPAPRWPSWKRRSVPASGTRCWEARPLQRARRRSCGSRATMGPPPAVRVDARRERSGATGRSTELRPAVLLSGGQRTGSGPGAHGSPHPPAAVRRGEKGAARHRGGRPTPSGSGLPAGDDPAAIPLPRLPLHRPLPPSRGHPRRARGRRVHAQRHRAPQELRRGTPSCCRLSASDTSLGATDDVSVTVTPPNAAPGAERRPGPDHRPARDKPWRRARRHRLGLPAGSTLAHDLVRPGGSDVRDAAVARDHRDLPPARGRTCSR